jgi:hypothetical protein
MTEKSDLENITKEIQTDNDLEEKRNQPLVRKVLGASYDFLKTHSDLILYAIPPLIISGFAAHGALKCSAAEEPNYALVFALVSISNAFTAGVIFERDRYK